MDVSAIAATAPSALPGVLGQPSSAARTPAEQRKAVSGQFEAIMLRQMLSDSVGKMLGGEDSPSGSIYGYLLTDVFSQQLARAGGLGLGKVIEKQLTPAGEKS